MTQVSRSQVQVGMTYQIDDKGHKGVAKVITEDEIAFDMGVDHPYQYSSRHKGLLVCFNKSDDYKGFYLVD